MCLAASTAAAQPAVAEPARAATRFYFRLGALYLAPQVSSSKVELLNVSTLAGLAVSDGPVDGAGVTVDSVTLIAATIGYVLPVLNRRLALETILGLPPTIRFHASGTLADQSLAPTVLGIPTGIPPLGSDLAEAKVLPPVVTAVYRVHDFGPVTPVVGAGIAALFPYDEKVTNPVLTAVMQPEFSIASAFGPVLQAGLDARLWRSVHARLDLKYILVSTEATIKNIQVRTTLPILDTVTVGDAHVTVTVNPLVAQLAVGADF